MVRKMLALSVLMALAAACSSTSNQTKSSPTPSATGAVTGAVTATEKDFAISVANANAKAGSVTFGVTNSGPSVHEFVVFKSDLAEDKLPMKADGTAVDEAGAGVTHIDEIENIAKDATKTLTVTLAAGNYVLICNLPGHYKLGMHAKLSAA